MSNLGKFLISLLASTVLVIASIWIVEPRTVTTSVGLAVIMILFWPVVLCILGLMFGIIVGLLTDGENAGAGEAVEAGIVGGAWYYSRIISVRNPYFWGALLGSAIAVGTLYLYMVNFIQPKELQAHKHVRAIADQLEAQYRKSGHFPRVKGKYLHEALDLTSSAQWNGRLLEDPWGRPLVYDLIRDPFSQSFKVVSTGWNGQIDPETAVGDDIVEKRTVFNKSSVTKEVLKVGTKKALDYLKRKLKTNDHDASGD